MGAGLWKYSTHPLIRTRKGLRFWFELANVRTIGNSEKTKNFDVPSHHSLMTMFLYSYNIHITFLQLFKEIMNSRYRYLFKIHWRWKTFNNNTHLSFFSVSNQQIKTFRRFFQWKSKMEIQIQSLKSKRKKKYRKTTKVSHCTFWDPNSGV